MGTLADHIRSYYAALDSGDPDRVAEHFCDDAVHYYTRLGPHEGARTIGQHTKLGVDVLGAKWFIENVIEEGDQAAIEWTMTWRDPKSGEPRLDRGTEWFLFRDGKIAEVRAYHHSDAKNRQGDLLGFDHAGRGYTMLEDPVADLVDRALGAMNRRDVEALGELFEPDARWESDPRLPGAETYSERGAIVAFLRDFLEHWEEYNLEAETIEAKGDDVLVVARLRLRGRASQAQGEDKIGYLLRVRDGRIASVRSFIHGDGALEAFQAT